MRYFLVAFLTFFFVSLSGAQWNQSIIGPGSMRGNTFDAKVGMLRGDSLNRLYVSSDSGGIYEWEYSGGTWNAAVVYDSVGHIPLIAMGDARGDGVQRLYWCEFSDNGHLFEADWTGSTWQITVIDSGLKALNIFIGPGRNDGTPRLYTGNAGGPKGGLWEYSWNGSSWDILQISWSIMEGSGLVGDLKNDGVQRILSNSNILEEFTWNGSSYTYSTIEATTDAWPDPTLLGDGRNISNNHVYANTSLGRVEYVWDGSAWQSTFLVASGQRGDLQMAALHADGKNRIYSTFAEQTWNGTAPGPLTQYSWNGSSWDNEVVIDAVSGATAMLGSGVGRNDDTVRLYAPNWDDGGIVELTSTNPNVIVSDPAVGLFSESQKILPAWIGGHSELVSLVARYESLGWQVDLRGLTGQKLELYKFSKSGAFSAGRVFLLFHKNGERKTGTFLLQ